MAKRVSAGNICPHCGFIVGRKCPMCKRPGVLVIDPKKVLKDPEALKKLREENK